MKAADLLDTMAANANACILAFGEDHPCVVKILEMRCCVEQLVEDLEEAQKSEANWKLCSRHHGQRVSVLETENAKMKKRLAESDAYFSNPENFLP